MSTDVVSIKGLVSKSKMAPLCVTTQGKGDRRSKVIKGCISLFLKFFCMGTNQPHPSCSWWRSHQAKPLCPMTPPLTTVGSFQGAMPSNHSNPSRLPGVSKSPGSFSVDLPAHFSKLVSGSSFSTGLPVTVHSRPPLWYHAGFLELC